jgi:hypothetical protein
MAKWLEVDPDALTFAPDAHGNMRFYRGYECVGMVPNDRTAALIQEAAKGLQRGSLAK